MVEKKKYINNIKLVVSDFDGVFTNNMVWVDENGGESVCCNRSDGIGIAKLRREGISIIILSSEKNNVVRKRAQKLNIECYNGVESKYDILMDLVMEKNIKMENIAYVGNDINDLQCLNSVGLAVAVKDAYPEVQQAADIILKKCGGEGAIREFCDLIVAALD